MFQFKEFTIYQERCAMKVGTDGVLLGAWVELPDSGRVLDIGTGTGLIALMCAQRSRAVQVDALEIDQSAAVQAQENVAASPFYERVQVIAEDLQHYGRHCTERYDTIVCNPPYFVASLKPPTEQRSLARHTDSLSFEELAQGVTTLLKPDGQFSAILPVTEAQRFVEIAHCEGLYLRRLRHVYGTAEGKEIRWLMTFERQEGALAEDSLVIELARHCYTDDFKALTAPFYLKH